MVGAASTPGKYLVWHSQTRARKRERVWYRAYTSFVPVESAACNNDVNFIMRVLTKIELEGHGLGLRFKRCGDENDIKCGVTTTTMDAGVEPLVLFCLSNTRGRQPKHRLFP